MKNIRIPASYLALSMALLLAAGSAQAQFRAPTRNTPGGDSLGSGINLGAPPSTPAPATGAPSPASPTRIPSATTAPAAPGSAAPAAKAPIQTGSVDDKPTSAESVVQEIADCVLAGLPPDWTMAQVDVREISRKDKQREFEAIYSYLDAEGKAAAFMPCDQKQTALNVYKLNGALDPAKRNWVRATLVLSKEGKFELQYDYLDKEASATPAAPAAAAKKDAKKAPAPAAKKNPG